MMVALFIFTRRCIGIDVHEGGGGGGAEGGREVTDVHRHLTVTRGGYYYSCLSTDTLRGEIVARPASESRIEVWFIRAFI